MHVCRLLVGELVLDPLVSGGYLLSVSPTPVVPLTDLTDVTSSWYLRREATAIVPVRSSTLLMVVARMIHFLVVIPTFYHSHSSCTTDSLGGGDSVVKPQDGGHGDCPGRVLDSVAGGGKDDPLLSGDPLFLSLPPQMSLRWS